MKLWFDHLKFGDSFGIRYRFEKADTAIPAHSHTRETSHIVIVLKGLIRFVDHDTGKASFVWPGMIHQFDNSHRHEIIALENGTEIFNLFLYGQPIDWIGLPEREKHGVIDLD